MSIDVKLSHTFREMLEAAQIMRDFDAPQGPKTIALRLNEAAHCSTRIRIVGEGSSRKFPGGNIIELGYRDPVASRWGINAFDGSQARKMAHEGATVILMSNSGGTKEVLKLGRDLAAKNHPRIFGVTATPGSSLAELCPGRTHVLSCGKETGIAATKSVLEQALFLQAALLSEFPSKDARHQAADIIITTLTEGMTNTKMIDLLSAAPTVCFGGYTNGTGDELALKLSETCAHAVGYQGTDIMHGFLETADSKDVVVLIDPAEDDQENLRKKIAVKGLEVFVIGNKDNVFGPERTIQIPDMNGLKGYFQLAAGWRIMAEIAQAKNINIDKPKFATKQGYAEPVAAIPA